MKKRVLGILLASVLTLALAGCAGDSNTESNSTDPNTTSQVEQSEASDTTSDTMDEASYMEKVNALPDAITDFSNDMAEIMSTMSTAASQEDLDALLPQLEDLVRMSSLTMTLRPLTIPLRSMQKLMNVWPMPVRKWAMSWMNM